MAKVISIEVGQALTEICVVSYRDKNPKIYQSITIETPNGVIEDGILVARESFVNQLRDIFRTNRIKEKGIVFTVASNKIASREVTIPYVKENRIAQVLQANVEEYFPVDLTEYRLTHTVLGVMGDGKDRQYKLLVLAVPTTLLEGYLDIAKALGKEVVAIDYMGNSMLQLAKKIEMTDTCMVVNIDAFSTMLLVFSGGTLVSLRTIPYGVDQVVVAVQKGDDLSYPDAVRQLQEHTYIGNTEWDGVVALDALEDMNSSLDMLANAISRVVDFHNARPESEKIERLLLTGFGGNFGGMSVLLQERLDIVTASLSNIEGLSTYKEFAVDTLGNLVGCIGAGLHPLDLVSVVKAKHVGAASEDAKGQHIVPIVLGVGCMALAGALAVLAWIPHKEALEKRDRLQARVQELLPARQAHDRYLATKNLWQEVHTMYALSVNENHRFVDFIAELEEKMPKEIVVLSLSTNTQGVVLNIEVGSKDAAALVLCQLRAFESIEVVDTAAVTDVKNEAGIHTVSFSVNCAYAGVVQNELAKQQNELLSPDLAQADVAE